MSAEPKRRLQLLLDLHADDLRELASALINIGNDLEYDGRETRTITSGGYGSGYHLVLVCDPEMDHDKYAALIAPSPPRDGDNP